MGQEKVQKTIRTKFIVDPVLQKKLISNFFFLGIVMIFINVAMSYLMVRKLSGHLEQISQVSPEFYGFVIETSTDLMMYTLTLNIIIILSFCLYGLFFSNRIAGPIFNLNNAIQMILKGEKDVQVVFRKDDYFQELSENMNLLIKKLD